MYSELRLPNILLRGSTRHYSLFATRYSLVSSRSASRRDELRRGAERLDAARLVELLGEVLDLGVLRGALGLRDARPLHRWHGLGLRRFRLGLRLAPERRVADQELHAVVAKGEIPLTIPRLRQFRFGEAQARKRGEASRLQLGRLLVVRHVGDFLLEEIVLARGELRELLQPLVRLALLDLGELPCDLSDLLLLHVPQGVTGPVLARDAFDVRQRLDVGELDRILLPETGHELAAL